MAGYKIDIGILPHFSLTKFKLMQPKINPKFSVLIKIVDEEVRSYDLR